MRVLEGGAAFISTGESIPLVTAIAGYDRRGSRSAELRLKLFAGFLFIFRSCTSLFGNFFALTSSEERTYRYVR